MAVIGEPQEVWELPAPLDVPSPEPDSVPVPEREEELVEA